MRKLSLTTFILIGLVLGVLTGVFVGERAEILDPIGNGFIRLLQMAVLPYFIVALPLGFGRSTGGGFVSTLSLVLQPLPASSSSEPTLCAARFQPASLRVVRSRAQT